MMKKIILSPEDAMDEAIKDIVKCGKETKELTEEEKRIRRLESF